MTQWVPAIVAIVAMIANAAVLHATVTRHEKVIEDMRNAVHELEKEVAVLKALRLAAEPA